MSRPSIMGDFIPKPLQERLGDLEDTTYDAPLEGDILDFLAVGNVQCDNRKALKEALRLVHGKWIQAVKELNKMRGEAQEARNAVIDGRKKRGERLDGRPVRAAARVAKEKMRGGEGRK